MFLHILPVDFSCGADTARVDSVVGFRRPDSCSPSQL